VLAASVALVVSACGAGKKEAAGSSAAGSAGAKAFKDAGCGGCHALAAAATSGTVGPNLDQLKPDAARVERQVRNGGNGMPSFSTKLSDEKIRLIASFVGTWAGPAGVKRITFHPNDQKIEQCGTDPSCFIQAFGNLGYDEGPKVALDRLQQMETTNAVVRGNCHPIAHMIGAGALLRYKGSVAKAFAAGNPTCGAGYYHGLLQWKLAGVKSNQVAAVARSACDDPSIKANGFNHYQCVHGLGHGLMLYTAYDLPRALRLCHQLHPDDQTSCTGGVFMENLSSSFGLRSKWLSDKNLIYPCNIVSENDKLYCYLLVSSRILPAVKWNWRKAADWCRRSEPGWVDTCFQSYGRDVSGVARQGADGIRRICRLAGSGEKECIFGGVRDIVNNNLKDLAARRLCETVRRKFRSYCFEGIGTILGAAYQTPAERRAACAPFARGADLADCVRGTGA